MCWTYVAKTFAVTQTLFPSKLYSFWGNLWRLLGAFRVTCLTSFPHNSCQMKEISICTTVIFYFFWFFSIFSFKTDILAKNYPVRNSKKMWSDFCLTKKFQTIMYDINYLLLWVTYHGCCTKIYRRLLIDCVATSQNAQTFEEKSVWVTAKALATYFQNQKIQSTEQ